MCVWLCVPDPGHCEIRWELGDLHHLRSVGEFLKDPESQRELLFGVGIGFALLELKDEGEQKNQFRRGTEEQDKIQ